MSINKNPFGIVLKVGIFAIFYLTQALCQDGSSNNTVSANASPPQAIYYNISYGSDPQQIMDVYLPAGRNSTVSKVILLIHGGGWTGGKKEDMNVWIYPFYQAFPQHVIATMSYRLATPESPAFPKQIQDITAAISFLKSKANEYSFQGKFALMGASAGGHLSMLYGYGFDTNKDVRVICNHVGPASISDPSYTSNRAFDPVYPNLMGKGVRYPQNKTLFDKVSPVTYIQSTSPKTISFYGVTDPLIPLPQGYILDDALDNAAVISKIYWYPGGHGDWTSEQYAHMFKKITYFFKNYF